MFDYINSLDKPLAIEVMESSIEIDRIISDYITESSLLLCVEAEDEAAQQQVGGSKFIATIHKIVEKIKSIVNKMIETLKDIFVREDMSAEQYFEDPNVRIQLQQDYAKMQAEIEEERLKGRKFVQMISKGLHVDDHAVAAFCDKAANIGSKYGKVIITGTAAFALGKICAKKAKNASDEAAADEKTLDKIIQEEAKKKKYEWQDKKQAEKFKNHPNILKGVQSATKVERQAAQVMGGIAKLTTKYVGNTIQLGAEIRKAQGKLG